MNKAKTKPQLRQVGGTAKNRAARFESQVTPERRQQMIAEAAYYRAEQRSFMGGDPSEDWLQAEAEIDRLLEEGAAAP